MIPHIEVREKAVAEGVPETTIIKDYTLSWLLKEISDLNNSFVLKGGTGIRKVYVDDYRFSLNLDFTLTETVEVEEALKKAAQMAKRDSGIDFNNEVEIKTVRSGFEAKIPFRLFYPTLMKIKVDITTPENEAIILAVERRRLIHPYSDECIAWVQAYKIKEILAEKVRSLFERTRPRDLYDTWYISNIIKTSDIIPIIKKKFDFKQIKIN